MSNEILHKRIEKRFNDIFEIPPDVPNYIDKNLSHNLRPYQKEAIRYFIYTQRTDVSDISFNHLLFHMATGSGKTLVLASTILYLFKEKGIRNFIFFVNSDAIIKKTYDNLTNNNSTKYLFNPKGICIDGNLISIKVVDVFPNLPADNVIYLKLTTIQKLHMDLSSPRENCITFESLENVHLALLADEAHHINAFTRNDRRKLNKKEVEERTWENTVNKLLELHNDNRLIEFTATIDLTNDALFEKYHDKIVFQYDLKNFMRDGYSKNVVLLRANENDADKMMNGILLSQYRKYIALDHGIIIKPIILFKSNKIKISLAANAQFVSMISNISEPKLRRIVEKGSAVFQNKQSVWHKMFSYYGKANLEKVSRDLRWDFKKENILNANDTSFLSEENAVLLNTLEEINNPIRAIFAVAKLNEGWDVLNLFDIVRISEGSTNTKITTDSEAQLIGRGARYFPFTYNNEHSYTRRFDFAWNDLKIIETLHYHTINNNAYIKNLDNSLEAANIQIKEDQYEILEAKIKQKIRNMDFFKNGKIYINKLLPTCKDDYKSLKDYGISNNYDIKYETAIEQQLLSGKITTTATGLHEEKIKITKEIIYKSVHKNTFYQFENFSQYMPSISSMRDFIENKNFLGSLQFNITLPKGITIDDLTPVDKLLIMTEFLKYAEKKIRANYMKERGTTVFEGIVINQLVDDYVIEMNKVNQLVSNVTQVIRKRNMRGKDWYIYDQAIVNGLENNMIDFISEYIDKLQKKYNEVYLIRNERRIKIVEIGGVRGFMPDFLLYLRNQDVTYQVFIEPKGENLRKQDKWKEDFLLSLSTRTDVKILCENDSVRLIGIKFYSSEREHKQLFREDFMKKIF